MKKLILFILLCYSNVLLAELDASKLVRLNVDLKGVIKVENKIIIYGSNGSLLISKDSAISWIQVSIGDTYDIIDLQYISGKLQGIAINKFISKIYEISYDIKLNTSIIKDLDLNAGTLGNTQTRENIIYLGFDVGIYSFNYLTKELYKIVSNPSNPAQHFDNFILVDNYIIIPTYQDSILRYNLNNKQIEILSLFGKSFKSSKIVSYSNKLFVIYNEVLLRSSDFGNSWDSITVVNNSKLIVSNQYLYLYKYEYDSNKTIQIISEDGNDIKFSDKSSMFFKNYITKFQIEKIFDIGSLLSIAVGQEKLILISNNNSKTWNLVSNLNNKAQTINFNNKDIGIAITDFKQYYKTFDGGVTWLPINENSNTSSSSISTYFGYNYLDSSGSFLYLTTPVFLNNESYYNNFRYSLDTLKTFQSKSIDFSRFFELTRIVKLGEFIYFATINNNLNNMYSNIYKVDQNFNIINIQKFDSLFIWGIHTNNENNLEIICSQYKYHIPKVQGNSFELYDSTKVVIKESKNIGESWYDKQVIPELNKHYLKGHLAFKDKILTLSRLLSYNSAVIDTNTYLHEIKDGKLSLIHKFEDKGVNLIFVFNSIVYCLSDNKIYYQDKNNNWKEKLFLGFKGNNRTISFSFDNVFYFPSSTTQMNDNGYSNIYKYTDESPTSIVEAQIEDMTDLVTLNPSPLPANTFTKIGVIWSPIYKFDLSNIEVYDIYGVKVKSNLKTSLREYDTFRGELTIQTEDLLLYKNIPRNYYQIC
ncbi:MAG: hypothetical protein NTW25_14095 [Candidatus Kapabacteria bacterium]|nr:hypothetical protein [Candidatus Kapabacteria bacterium]